MNRNFIVFTLLAMLFMVNAVPHQLHERDGGTITFNNCPLAGIPTLTVSIVPNPIIARQSVSFSVFAILNNATVAGNTTLAIEFADATGKTILTDVYYQVFTEPFNAGAKVSIVAPSVLAPDELPDVYTLGVAIGDPIIGDPITPFDIFGCTYAVVGSTPESISDFQFPGIVA